MNFLNIKYFIAIAEEQSISAASRKLFVSQQALSEHLKKLEEEVGVPLFKRTSPLTMTVAGECLYDGGKTLLTDYDRMMANIRNVTDVRRSRITVATATYAMPPFLPGLLTRFKEKYPQFEVTVIKRQHTDIIHNMVGVDLYISYLPVEPDLEVVPIISEDPYCAVFRNDLAERTLGSEWPAVQEQLEETQDLRLLQPLPFIILQDRLGQITQDLKFIFDEHGMVPRVSFFSENGDLNAQMCLQGAGILLMPENCAFRTFPHSPDSLVNDLIFAPIRVTSFQPMLAVCYEKGKHLHLAEISFINEMRDMLA